MYGLLNELVLRLVRAWAPSLPLLYSVGENVLVFNFFLSLCLKMSSVKAEISRIE